MKSSRPDTLRVAFCFSGQLRTWKDCIYTWQDLFNTLKETYDVTNIDVFSHAWDHNTLQHGIAMTQIKDGVLIDPMDNSVVLPDSEINEYINLLNPVSYKISDIIVSKSTIKQTYNQTKIDSHLTCTNAWLSPQYYSIMYSAHLKRMHEIKYDFKYDACVRMRNDLHLGDISRSHISVDNMIRPKFNTIYSSHTGVDESQWFRRRLGDLFWYADSPTFDKISNFYQWLSLLNLPQTMPLHTAPPEHLLYYYAKMFNILIEPDPSDPKIARSKEYVKLKQDSGNGSLGSHEIVC